MMKSLILLFTAVLAFGQVTDTGPRQVGPAVVFASLPTAASYDNRSVTVTDCLTQACAAGGGSYAVVMTSNGTDWYPAGGGGGGVTFTTPYIVNSGSYYFPGMYSAATLPSATTWTATGGTSTWTAAGDAYTLSTAAPGGNGANVSGQRDSTALSSGDFTVTTFLNGCFNPAQTVVANSGCGLFLYDGTKYITWGMDTNSGTQPVLAYNYYTTATASSSLTQVGGQFFYTSIGLIGFRITKSSGNLAFAHTTDGGMQWITDFSGISCTAHFASCASINAGVHVSPTWTGASAATSVVSWLRQ